MEYNFITYGEDHNLKVEEEKDFLEITLGSKKHRMEILSISKNEIQLIAGNKKILARIAEMNGTYYVCIDGVAFQIEDKDLLESEKSFTSKVGGETGEKEVKAPMPGKVIKIFVSEGDLVESGSKVAILEAMKMENELTAPIKGKIAKVLVKEGDLVEANQKIVELEER